MSGRQNDVALDAGRSGLEGLGRERRAAGRCDTESRDGGRRSDACRLTDAASFLDAVQARLVESLAFAADAGGVVTAGLPSSALVEASSLETLVRDLLAAGGKLVRPRLVRLGYLAARECTNPDDDPATTDAVVRVAAAFELLHLFGLLQDDVMDASDTRRGAPTAHHQVRAAAPQPDGPDAARLGDSVAVLAGDLAFALANRLVRALPEHVADAWDAAVVELVTGQRLDLVFAAEARLDEVSTRRVAHAKSGAYTVQRPLEIGALLAGESAPPAWLSRFGAALGEAFALADDIIGLWGEPAVTGKPAGEDLRERKPTTVLGLAALGLLYGAGLSVYHAGAEWSLWAGPTDCGGGAGANPSDVGDFLNALQSTRVADCSTAAWRLAGISLAGWNALIAFALASVAGTAALKR
mgnify:CR=1 FL=1